MIKKEELMNLIAEKTGTQHKNVLELIKTYNDELSQFGRVAFET
jgi:phage regulator Rha-like protein